MRLSRKFFGFFKFCAFRALRRAGKRGRGLIDRKFCPADPQRAAWAARCGLCGRELYDGDAFYAVNGLAVCEECLPAFAREEYRAFRVTGREWRMS